MSGCECKRGGSVSATARNIKRSAQPEMKGIRPILKKLRTLAGFLFFFVAAAFVRRQKIQSREKSKLSPDFQKFRGALKTTPEDRKLWLET
jgi:hypothetical protein